MDVKLIITKGKAQGRAIPLPSTIVTIGRGKKCHLRPHCRLVSKLHCAIASWAGKVVVRDLNSSNGTYVNDRRVQGEARVNDGDTLRIGTLEFTFRIQVNEQTPPMQVVFPSQIKWLTDSQEGSTLLSPFETQSQAQPAGFAPSAGAVDLSAGDDLREYLRQRT